MIEPNPITVTIHNREILVNGNHPFPEHIQQVQEGRWEPQTFDIFDAFLNKDHSYVDMGAWMGITSLYGAHLAKHCYSIEPDPVAFGYLSTNVSLNPKLRSKITLSNQCIFNKNGTVNLRNHYTTAGGNSGSSILEIDKSLVSWKVPAIRFEQFVEENNITDCNFIKMDIEGAEGVVLPDMAEHLKKYKPTLYISLHPWFFKEDFDTAMPKIMEILSNYHHVFNIKGEEIPVSILSNESMMYFFYELVATDVPINQLKKTKWGEQVK